MQTQVFTPDQLASQVPHMLGFTPRESVVIAPLTRNGRVQMLARVDIVDVHLNQGANNPLLATARYTAEGTAALILMVFSARPAAELAQPMSAAAAQCAEFIGTVLTFHVQGDTITTYGEDQARPLPFTANPVRDTMPEGKPDPAHVAEATEATENAGNKTETTTRVATLEAYQAATKHATEGTYDYEVKPAHLGIIAAGLADKTARDAIAVLAVDSTRTEAAERLARGAKDDPAVSAVMNMITDQAEGVEPEREATTAHATVLWDVWHHSTDPYARIHALEVLAMLSFWWGDDRQVTFLADEARNIGKANDIRANLAEIMAAAVASGLQAGWKARTLGTQMD